MEIPKYFYIKDKKTLIFRQEGDFYITFNPETLEFFKINFIATQILYLISINYTLEQIKEYFINKYSISEKTIENDLKTFLKDFSCSSLISNKLKLLDLI